VAVVGRCAVAVVGRCAVAVGVDWLASPARNG